MILEAIKIIIEVGKRMELDEVAKEKNCTRQDLIIQFIDAGLEYYSKLKM